MVTLGESEVGHEGVTCSQASVFLPIGGDDIATFQAWGEGMKGLEENIHQPV